MRIHVVGVGYVGLVSGACLADNHQVTALDIDAEKVEKLNSGQIPIHEPGLDDVVLKNIQENRLSFTTNYETVAEADVCFIAVDTPNAADGSADISRVKAVAKNIANFLTHNCVIVIKSTVPPGTSDKIEKTIRKFLEQQNKQIEVSVVSNPEFLREGTAVVDFMHPDRVIIGAENPDAIEIMQRVYEPLNLAMNKIFFMDRRSAELAKYAANAALALRISFINEMAKLCSANGASIDHVCQAIGSDPRIGNKFHQPGVGYGGSCFPKDVKALIHQSKAMQVAMPVIEAIQETNERQKQIMVDMLSSHFQDYGGLEGKTIALMGLSFKPNTDDMREAPSLVIIDLLRKQGVNLQLFDPIAVENAKKIVGEDPSITWFEDEKDFGNGAHALVLVTEWPEFTELDFASILQRMNGHALFDGRNLFRPEEMAKLGFDYRGIGRKPLARVINFDAA